ncbi:response regulator transcription factor [Streptomyces sp. NPDC005529]|uniref:response regulator transcription factor n=1 Tax=unclassified Streptomyces TaxID=2593676 RepID=UPI0033B6A73B
MSRVLVVEDDPRIRTLLIEILTEQGHIVRSTGSGFEALREVTREDLDAVLLDLGLPDLDGYDTLQMMRGVSSVPVLVVTARDDEREVIKLLNAGADDYVVKPFSGGELIARLTAVLRRAAGRSSTPSTDGVGRPSATALRQPVSVGDLVVDPPARTVLLSGLEISLTRREFDLLSFLAHHAGQVISKQQLIDEVWREPYVEDQTIDVHLYNLRRKLGERAAAPRYLQTVRGVGIKLVAPR